MKAADHNEGNQMNDNRATYCPEDNKLRLYVGRVPRDEYEALRAEGWTSTPKQDCDFVATWTPARVARCLSYADLIEDEDAGPAERAADRAERFAEYRDKRTAEATGHADRYDAGPLAHGYQNAARAERAAARHDRQAGHAVSAWDKAEYWTRRTAGVISHALYTSTPAVRMGRIKTLEAELRKAEKSLEEAAARFAMWRRIEATPEGDTQNQTRAATHYAGGNGDPWTRYQHPRPASMSDWQKANGCSLYDLLTRDADPITGAEACALFFAEHAEPATENAWTTHYKLRLAYENQMLEAQGGRAAFVEMIPGGFIGKHQVQKVNKSPATGRVVSVAVKVPAVTGWEYQTRNVKGTDYALRTIETERLPADAYRAPTDAELAAFHTEKAASKAAAPKSTAPALVNPTGIDAERLQEVWNAANKRDQWNADEVRTVARMTQAEYSAMSGGTYSSAETVYLTGGGLIQRHRHGLQDFPAVAKVRRLGARVVILTDKPQKALPAATWNDPRPAVRAAVAARIHELTAALRNSWLEDAQKAAGPLLDDARRVRLAWVDSMTQYGLTDEGKALLAAQAPAAPRPAATVQPELALA